MLVMEYNLNIGFIKNKIYKIYIRKIIKKDLKKGNRIRLELFKVDNIFWEIKYLLKFGWQLKLLFFLSVAIL